MKELTHNEPEVIELLNTETDTDNSLILYNDEHHTFDYVIDCLVEVCKHSNLQAEQCAWITHNKGKCDVKNGSYTQLKPMKDSLIDKELIVDIE